MRPVSPDIGFDERVAAENQLQYKSIPVAQVPHDDGSVSLVTRWRLTPEEREAIARGADLYVSQLNFGAPMSPLLITLTPPYAPVVDPHPRT